MAQDDAMKMKYDETDTWFGDGWLKWMKGSLLVSRVESPGNKEDEQYSR